MCVRVCVLGLEGVHWKEGVFFFFPLMIVCRSFKSDKEVSHFFAKYSYPQILIRACRNFNNIKSIDQIIKRTSLWIWNSISLFLYTCFLNLKLTPSCCLSLNFYILSEDFDLWNYH